MRFTQIPTARHLPIVKLSQALREVMKQARCSLFHLNAGEFWACCSLGAMMPCTFGEKGYRDKGQDELTQQLWDVRPELGSVENGSALFDHFNISVEKRGVILKSLEWAIAYLNDEKHLPANQIAQGLDAIGL